MLQNAITKFRILVYVSLISILLVNVIKDNDKW